MASNNMDNSEVMTQLPECLQDFNQYIIITKGLPDKKIMANLQIYSDKYVNVNTDHSRTIAIQINKILPESDRQIYIDALTELPSLYRQIGYTAVAKHLQRIHQILAEKKGCWSWICNQWQKGKCLFVIKVLCLLLGVALIGLKIFKLVKLFQELLWDSFQIGTKICQIALGLFCLWKLCLKSFWESIKPQSQNKSLAPAIKPQNPKIIKDTLSKIESYQFNINRRDDEFGRDMLSDQSSQKEQLSQVNMNGRKNLTLVHNLQ